MKAFILISAFVGALIVTDACAQVEVTVPETGRVKTTAKVENGILGVTNSFTRFRGTHGMRGSLFLRERHQDPGLAMPGFGLQSRLFRKRTDRRMLSLLSSEGNGSAIHLKDTLSKLTSSACRSTPVF